MSDPMGVRRRQEEQHRERMERLAKEQAQAAKEQAREAKKQTEDLRRMRQLQEYAQNTSAYGSGESTAY